MGNRHHVTVHSIESYSGKAFMGIDADDAGYVSVILSSHNEPTVTYLVQMSDNFLLKVIQFDDIDWAKDWVTQWQHWLVWMKQVLYIPNWKDGPVSRVSVSDIAWEQLIIPDDHPMCPEIKEGP